MSCNTKTLLQLTLFVLIFTTFFSCSKEEIQINDRVIKETPIEETPTEPHYDRFLANSLVVLESEKILRNLVLQSIYQLYFYPQLADVQSNQATIRSGCPMSSINAAETVVTLTYDNCNTSSAVNYSGTVTLTITGTLGVFGTTVLIELSDDFTVGGDQDIDGTVKLEYDNIAIDKYNIVELDIDNNSTAPATQVRLSTLGQVAHFELVDVNSDDDNSNPLTFLDNEVLFDPYITVHCPNPDGVTQTSLDVSPVGTKVKYSIICGMPYDGEIQIDESGTFHSSIDFSYPNATSGGVCDGEFNICKPDGLGFGGTTCSPDSF